MDSREEKEDETIKLRAQLDALRKEHVEMFKSFVDEKPLQFVKLLCEAILGTGDQENNPFMVGADSSSDFVRTFTATTKRIHGSFAQLMLDKIRDEEEGKVDQEKEYIPFSEMLKDWFSVTFKWLRASDLGEVSDLASLIHAFLENYSDDLASAIDSVSRMVYEGVPLYRRESGDRITRIEFDDPLYLYIFKKGEFWETGKTIYVPDWVDNLYFKRSDLDAHDAYFSGAGEMTDQALAMRREAMRATLGLSKEGKPKTEQTLRREHKTKLLDFAYIVIDRYYGSQYNENDPTTITSQKMVVDWLKNTHGLSDREAQAIDIVTRPDSARRK